MSRAFVSHSTSDDSYVAEMESFLLAAGFDEVFNDVNAICPDEKFWPEIEKGIANCDCFVVVITFASSSSEWVKREVEYARSLSKNIIPIWIEDCPVPPTFADRDVIDFRPRTRKERRFDIVRIVEYAPVELIGREDEMGLLYDAWGKVLRIEKGRAHVVTFVALGGEGKTSLVAKWAAELANQDWPGCDAAFAWTFYSQGTREQLADSSDLFLKEALTFFGDDVDKKFAASNASAFEKGQRLARIVGRLRSLIILDGLEPLQYAPASPMPGQLKDQGIAALLKGLAAASHGLCVVTTRYSLPDLKAFWETTAREVKLMRLSRAAGVHLLQSLDVKGSLLRNIPFHDGREQVNEFEKLVEDVQGHALALNLLGTYLRDAHAGDIRKRDCVKLEEADAEEQGGHAFRVMEAYEREFEREDEKSKRALAVLRLLGLFDRPLTSDCLGALLQAPVIPGLTEPLLDLTEAQRNVALKRLENARLIMVNRDAAGALNTLDAHPLLREYFARQLCAQQSDDWRDAHRRLYEHLSVSTREGDRPTLETLQPLYHAVAHGCQAGAYQKVCDDIYLRRILRGAEHYSWGLGAFGAELGALALFFDEPWSRPVVELSEQSRTWLLNEVAIVLGAMNRISEAIQAMRTVLDRDVSLKSWGEAATSAGNLSELEIALGDVDAAVADGEKGVEFAERGGSKFEQKQMTCLAILADALHQAGNSEALACFRETEVRQEKLQPEYTTLYSGRGFRFCELLLGKTERAAWRKVLKQEAKMPRWKWKEACREVRERAEQALKWDRPFGRQIDIGFHNLTLGRAALYAVLLEEGLGGSFRRWFRSADAWSTIDAYLAEALRGFLTGGDMAQIPRGFLTRAWLRFAQGDSNGARADLDEAQQIAGRGPMRLHMADIHLHRARLFFREAQYPWESPQADLAAAEKLIQSCGYHRRDEELANAKAALQSI